MKNQIKIIVDNFSKTTKEKVILSHINLELNPNKIYGFVGHNGSGKSMLFKAICGFVKGNNGKILVNGYEIGKEIDFPDETGILIEEPGFLPNLSGFKNLRLLADIQNKINDNKIYDFIKSVGLDPNDKRPVKKYSLGMRQRLGIAQALMENPKLIILDEPMNGLDDEGVEIIRNLILKFKSVDTIILLASHNKEDIEILCDEVFKLSNGKLVT